MRRAVAIAVLALAARGAASRSDPKDVALGEEFALAAGEAARVRGEALTVRFESVPADSRCGKGEQCVWEGDATVRLSLQKGSEAPKTLDLHTSKRARSSESSQSSAAVDAYSVRLVGLEPQRVSGKTIDPADYVATLAVSSSAAAERQ